MPMRGPRAMRRGESVSYSSIHTLSPTDKDFATVLTICTAILAPIIPPSIVAVIYAWMADESVAAIFAGGYLPGLLVGIGMSIPVFVIARRRNYPREPRPTLRTFTAALWNALPGMMIPVIIM